MKNYTKLLFSLCALLVMSACKKEEKTDEPQANVYGNASHNGKSLDLHKAAVYLMNYGDSSYAFDIYAYSKSVDMEFDYSAQDGIVSSGYSALAGSGALLSMSLLSNSLNISGANFTEDSIQSNFYSTIFANLRDFGSDDNLKGDNVSITVNSYSSSAINFSVTFKTADGTEATANYSGPVAHTELKP